jgi:hypothetical protein
MPLRIDPSNPDGNQLPPGVDETELIGAIESSGYPLQGVVASILDGRFAVTEEWGYIDRDTKEHRTLDVFAHKSLTDDRTVPVRPSVVLLIECKRSRHPYIFFRTLPNLPIPRFPRVVGIPNRGVTIAQQDGKRFSERSGAEILGLDQLPFVKPGPPKCAAFSKAIVSGKKVELSGSDPFNSLVLPLVKAQVHAAQQFKAPEKPIWIFPTLMLSISVLDAPMLLVTDPEQAGDPLMTPWVRIIRQEANPNPQSRRGYSYYSFDAVHIGFFEDYLTKHVLPYAEDFGKRAIEKAGVLFNGGEVPNLTAWEWHEVKERSNNK